MTLICLMTIPWSALMTRAFTISIKAAAWIRTRHLPLSVQWPVSSTKGIMWSFCVKNFWCKTLMKQDYEPGDQRLSMYHLISNSTKNIIDFFGLIVTSAFYWCMKIYWLCFDLTNVHYFKDIKTGMIWSINEILPVSLFLKSKWYLFMNYNSVISAHDMGIYHLNRSRSMDSNLGPCAFGSVTGLKQ